MPPSGTTTAGSLEIKFALPSKTATVSVTQRIRPWTGRLDTTAEDVHRKVIVGAGLTVVIK
eukprot:scaffold2230_cov187-Amphora_coffeaeformis.AAC.18